MYLFIYNKPQTQNPKPCLVVSSSRPPWAPVTPRQSFRRGFFGVALGLGFTVSGFGIRVLGSWGKLCVLEASFGRVGFGGPLKILNPTP